MKREDRKAAIAAYKERKPVAGIFEVCCAATNQRWVGAAPDLATIWNRVSFALRQGAGTPASLQAAWREHGAKYLGFKILEEVAADELAYGRDRALRKRRDHWCKVLGAEAI
ncbi:MAG TPA: GIY-YIG nuclease family protein [Rhizomicrobium sp.]|nr:GIY-YIG nuclease family protein [Rhizomicrobium sp.]